MKPIEQITAIIAMMALATSTATASQHPTEPHPVEAGDIHTCVMSKNFVRKFEENQKKIDAMRQEQSRLLLELKRKITDLQPSQRKDDLSRRLSEIEQRANSEENAVPGVQPLTLACPLQAAASKKYAREVISRISECGTRNHPVKEGKKVYGSGTFSFVLDRNGNIVRSSIEDSSHNEFLDAAILRLAESSSPFGPVPAALHAGKFKQFLFFMQFRFEREEHDQVLPEKRCVYQPASTENGEAGT